MSLETDTVTTIQAALVAALPSTTIRWLPSDAPFAPPTDAAWLQVTLLWAQGLRHTMSPTGKNLLLGALICNAFAPLRLDVTLAHAVMATVRDTLNRVELAGVVRFDVPRPGQPSRYDNIYWQVHSEVSLSVEEVLSG